MKSVKGTLAKGFVLLFVFLAAQAFVVWKYLSESKRDIVTSVHQNFAASTQLAELASLGQALRRFEKEYFIYIGDTQKREGYSKEWQQSHEKIMKSLDDIRSNRMGIWTAGDRLEANKWEAAAGAYGDGFRALGRKVDGNDITTTLAANEAIREAKDKFRVYLQGTSDTLKRKNDESQRLGMSVNARFELILVISGVLFIAACVLLAVIATFVVRAIESPINSLAEAAESMSGGNLEQPFRLKSSVREFRALAEHLERMRVAQKGLLDSLMRKSRGAQA